MYIPMYVRTYVNTYIVHTYESEYVRMYTMYNVHYISTCE